LSTTSKIPTLLLVRHYTETLSYFDDWLDAFKRSPRLALEVGNIEDEERLPVLRDKIESYPLMVCLHSTNGDGVAQLQKISTALQNRKGALVVFVGNEVNLLLAPMADKLSFLNAVSADMIATQLVQEAGEWYYQVVPSAKVCSLPHGLNPSVFTPGQNLAERHIDIGARSADYGLYLGDNERVALHEFFLRNRKKHGLTVDIKIGGGRFSRAQWADFLRRCKGTISTEAGSAYLDRNDFHTQSIYRLLLQRTSRKLNLSPDSMSRRIIRMILPGWMRHQIAVRLRNRLVEVPCTSTILFGIDKETMLEIQEAVFRELEPNRHYTKAISSRHFDAVGTKTVQILFPGRYNDIFKADEHFIPLAKDFSNLEEALKKFRDLSLCRQMINETYDYVLSAHTCDHRVAGLVRSVEPLLGQ
jgi:hypothetical protein